MKLKNQTILITGGSSGIGEAIAKLFIKEGAKVIIFDIQKSKIKNVNFIKVDIRDEYQIIKAFKKINKLDVLVNNAGVYLQKKINKISEKELNIVVDTNLKGTCLMCKHAIDLIKKNRGSIINISSGLGVVPEPESPVYCATKSAIIMLTKSLAQEYAKFGLRINAILPGPIDTPMLRKEFKTKKELEKYAKMNPMKKIGKTEDVAKVALFLASKQDSKYVTGGLYSVDGGESTSSLYTK